LSVSLSKVFDIASGAVAAQSQRLNAVASNLANADSAAAPGEQPYRARQVVFEATPARDGTAGVRVARVAEDLSPPRRHYDPRHPFADAEGYVSLSNVNVVDEMVNMISAARAYQNNLEVMNTARNLMLKTLSLGS
jgi:flagellar basal-body rod protein FlgC